MENFLGDLLPALQGQGCRIAALVHDHGGGPGGEASRESGCELLWRVPCYGQLLHAPLSPDFGRQLARLAREFRPEVVHLHLPNVSAFWALLLPRLRKIPWVVHWHADVVSPRLEPRLTAAYWFYRPWERAVLARAAAVVATSPDYLASSRPLLPWRDKCHVVPLGLDPARMAAVGGGDEAGWGDGFRLLLVGRLTYYKGHEVAIAAVARLTGVELLIVGAGGGAAKLHRLIAALGVGGKVRLLGDLPAPRLHRLLASADALCLSSLERTEAFGLVLLEAMWYAKPVLATSVEGSGMGWVVEDGRTGLLTAPGDVAALAAAISRLRDEPALAAALGRAGREKMWKQFRIATVATRVGAIYRRILAKV